MSDLVERLRERPSRYASETEEQAKERRQQEREEAADRIERLESALRPFAECARVFDPDMLGGTMPKTGPWQSWPRMVDDKLHMYELTVEHLREARAALEERT